MQLIDAVLDLANDLQAYLDGKIGEEAILETYFTGPIHPELKDIKESLGQYVDDYDKRENDENYRIMQEKEMDKLIDYLRLNNITHAKKINFLYETEIEY